MVKQRKGIFGLLIVAGIILSMLFIGIQTNQAVFAAEGFWNDNIGAETALTLENPHEANSSTNAYTISTPQELALLSHNVNNGEEYINTYFLQTADLDMSAHFFSPIGSQGKRFAGIYDGGGKEISGLSIVLSDEDGVGLFGNVSTTVSEEDEAGTLRNINITSGSIIAMSNMGSIAGSFVGKRIENCSSGVSLQYGTGVIQNVGGIVGSNYGVIEGCHFYGSINAGLLGRNVGGIVGLNGSSLTDRFAKIINSFNTGAINAAAMVGGIVGENYGDISAVYNNGTLTASSTSGGLVGYHGGGLSDGYNIGKLNFSNSFVGAIIGNRAQDSDANNLYYANSDSNTTYSIKAIGTESMNLSGATDSPSEDIVGLHYYEMINNADSMQLGTSWVFSKSTEGFGYTPCFDSAKKELSKLALFGGNTASASWGTVDQPYILNNAHQFVLLSNIINDPSNTGDNAITYEEKYFAILNDIDFSDITDFSPIGTQSISFRGFLEGNGYVLSNLVVEATDAALFGYIASSSINAVNITGFDMSGDSAATLAANAQNSSILSCSVSDSVISALTYAGGIIGRASSTTFVDCISDAAVQSSAYAGGICGYAQDASAFSKSYFTGELSGGTAGGIAGKLSGSSISNSFIYTEQVEGSVAAGGIIGEGSVYTINTCYVVGNILSDSAAGFVGSSIGDAADKIINGYFIGNIASGGSSIVNGAASIENVYYNFDFITSASVSLNGTAKNTIELTNADFFATGFTMDTRTGLTGSYPQITEFYEQQISKDSTYVNYFDSGEGNSSNPYSLSEELDLINMQRLISAYFSDYGSAYYAMIDDIVLSKDFVPIASYENPFVGRLEGNYYSIYNLTINEPDTDYVGLFRVIGSGAYVTELNIRPYVVSPTEIYGGITGKNYVGAIAGSSKGFIWDCMNNADVTGESLVGGIAGNAKNVSRSCNTATVTGLNQVGGIVGLAEGSIQSSFNSGYIKGNGDFIGGIAGNTGSGNIIEVCYNSGDIESDAVGGIYQGNFKGGIVGYNTLGAILRNSYNIGGIKGTSGMTAGGIIGDNKSSEVTLCYFNNEILSGFSAVGTGTVPGSTVSGLTTVQMVGASALDNMVFSSGNYISAEERGMDADFAPQLIIFYNITAEPGENADIISTMKDYSKQSVMLRLFGRDVYNILEWGGEYNAYRIDTFDHLDTLSKQVMNGYTFSDCYFEMTADITMLSTFLPIGQFNLVDAAQSFVFRGHFDGKGFTISDLEVGAEDTTYSQGLFGYIGENAVLKNIIVSSGSVIGSERVGSIVGYSKGTVDRCYSSASVLGANNVGGIVGMLMTYGVTNCLFDGTILGNSNWGGIVGFFEDQYAFIKNCWYIKDINAADSHNRIGSVVYIDKNGDIQAAVDISATDKDFIYFEFLPDADFGFEMRNITEDLIIFDAGGIQSNKYYPMYNAQAAGGLARNWYARFTKSVTIATLSNATATGGGNYYEDQPVVITVYPEKGYRLVLDYGTYSSYIGDGVYVDCMRTMDNYSWEFTASIVPFGNGATEIINPDGIKAEITGDHFDYDGQPKQYSINIPGFVAYTEYYRESPRIRIDEPINATEYQLIIKLQEGGVIVGSKDIFYSITPLKLTLDLAELSQSNYSAKQYDKYSYNEINIDATAIIGVVGNDEVLLTAIRKYFEDGALNPNIGENKLITFEDFNLSGTGASNYSVPDAVTDVLGSIIKRNAWINILSENLSKQYDGNAPIIQAHSFEGDLGDGLFVNEFSFIRVGEPLGGAWGAGQYSIGLTENIAGNKENYNILLKESYTFIIDKKIISNVTFNGYQSLAYNGLSQASAIQARYPLTANTFGYAELLFYHDNQPITAEGVKNAGAYIARAVISDTDAHNFELDGEKSVSFSISRVSQAEFLLEEIGDNTFALDAVQLVVSGGSGEGAVSFEVLQGKAGINNSYLFIKGAGEISIRATKEASTNFFKQNSNIVTFNISKGILTATLDDVYVSYGDTPKIELRYEGMLRGEVDKSDITGLIEPEVYAVGEDFVVNEEGYEILLRDNGNADGYIIDVSSISARLFVSRKQVHIMANPATKIYGSVDPNLSYTVLEGNIALQGELKRAIGETVGRYLIEQHTLTNDNNQNYEIIYVPDYFTVSRKELRVSIPIFTKVYKQTEPAYQSGAPVSEGINFVVNESDLRLGDNLSVLSGYITRDAGENAGQYAFRYRDISAGKNYSVIVTEVRHLLIKKANPEFPLPTASDITYGDTLSDSVIRGEADVAGQFFWKDSGIRPSVHNSNLTEYPVTFIPSDGANYNKLDSNIKLTVKPKKITITFTSNVIFVYDGNNKAFVQVAAYNTLPQDELEIKVTYSSQYLINAGEYTATAQIDDMNYEVQGESEVTITIVKSQLTAKVSDATIIEGNDFVPEITYIGFIEADDVSSLSKVPRVRNIPSKPDEHSIIAEGGEAMNYSFSYVPGKLIINRKSVQKDDFKLEGELSHGASVDINSIDADSGVFGMVNNAVTAVLADTSFKNSTLNSFTRISVTGQLQEEYKYNLKMSITEGSPIIVQHTDGSIELMSNYTYEDGYVSFVSSNVVGIGSLREATFIEKYEKYLLYGGIGAGVILIGVLIGIIAKKIKKRKARLTPKFRD